jgi:hypothetical protein
MNILSAPWYNEIPIGDHGDRKVNKSKFDRRGGDIRLIIDWLLSTQLLFCKPVN